MYIIKVTYSSGVVMWYFGDTSDGTVPQLVKERAQAKPMPRGDAAFTANWILHDFLAGGRDGDKVTFEPQAE